MEVVDMKPLRLLSRCDRAGCTTCQKLDEYASRLLFQRNVVFDEPDSSCRRGSSCLELDLATTFSRDEKFKKCPPVAFHPS